MGCEYITDETKWIGKTPFCNLTKKPCPVLCELDRTAYRHCLRREWATRYLDKQPVHLSAGSKQGFLALTKSPLLPLLDLGPIVPPT